MYRKLGEETLKSGDRLEIGVAIAPETALAEAVEGLLGHKQEEWRYHISSALRGETDRLETRFYIGLLSGAPVANVMTTEQHGVGILGHVFTRPEHRRNGICRAIMSRQMQDFRARGGRVLLLGTGFESPPYWIYHSFGFRSLKGGFMRFAADDDVSFEQDWFAVQGARLAQPEWRHWPLAALLASIPDTDMLRSFAWGVYGFGNLEGPYVGFMHRLRTRGDVRGAILEADNGAVVGWATAYPASGWPGVTLVDEFVHASHYAHLPELIRSLGVPTGRAISYVDADAPHKAAALESCGFVREGTLRHHLRLQDGARDVLIYGREYA